MRFDVDFTRAPLLTIWETTRSCPLACRHCRAEAQLGRDPHELNTVEGLGLAKAVAAMGTPLFILSGGDPLQRADLEVLITGAREQGLRVGTIPAGTESLTPERVASLQAAGLNQMALSFDAPAAPLHDHFRDTPGAFEHTLRGARAARELGLPLQVNSVFGSWNLPYLEEMIAFVRELGAVFWEVFLLVPVGRGRLLQGCSAEEVRQLYARLAAVAAEGGCVVKVTEGQHFKLAPALLNNSQGPAPTLHEIGSSRAAVNAGNGFCFVDHVGNICPSGFLPEVAGTVRTHDLAAVYRKSPLFAALRDTERLRGRCGRCAYRRECGGSRSRAFALRGDVHAEDPLCPYTDEEVIVG